MSLTLALVIVCSAALVYFDATRHRVGKLPDEEGIFNLSAKQWMMAVLLFWVIALPTYLMRRHELLMRARQFPIEEERQPILTTLATVAVLLILAKVILRH